MIEAERIKLVFIFHIFCCFFCCYDSHLGSLQANLSKFPTCSILSVLLLNRKW